MNSLEMLQLFLSGTNVLRHPPNQGHRPAVAVGAERLRRDYSRSGRGENLQNSSDPTWRTTTKAEGLRLYVESRVTREHPSIHRPFSLVPNFNALLDGLHTTNADTNPIRLKSFNSCNVLLSRRVRFPEMRYRGGKPNLRRTNWTLLVLPSPSDCLTLWRSKVSVIHLDLGRRES